MFKLTLDELLRKELSDTRGGSYLSKRRTQKLIAASNEIQLVPVKAAAGYLAGYADPEFLDELNTFTLPMLAPGNYRAFEIVGDSMLPTPSGSVIVGEKVDDLEEVKSNQTYIVVSRNEGIVYKRVMKNNKSKSKLTLISDNTAYQPYQCEFGRRHRSVESPDDHQQGQYPASLGCQPIGQPGHQSAGAGHYIEKENELNASRPATLHQRAAPICMISGSSANTLSSGAGSIDTVPVHRPNAGSTA